MDQSISQSKHISIAPYVASESETHTSDCSRVTVVEWNFKLQHKQWQQEIPQKV